LKVASFSVRASQEQAYRWNRAASADGFQSTGAWLAYAADCFLKARARAALPVALAWSLGCFRVRLEGAEVELRGFLSIPFAIFRGTRNGPRSKGCRCFSLVYLPDRRIVATLRTHGECKRLASELAPLFARDTHDGAALIEHHVREQA
jgi:hypothetical protein